MTLSSLLRVTKRRRAPGRKARRGSRDEIIGRVTQVRSEGDMMGRTMNGYWLRRGPWFFSWDVDTVETGLHHVLDDPRRELDLAAEKPELVADFKDRINLWRSAFDI